MANIIFDSIDTVAKTVSVEVDGVMVTRPLPDFALVSVEAMDEYMKAYVAGLNAEFPSAAPVIADADVSFSKGQNLTQPADVV
jgi:hypothetical protein